LSKPSSYRMRLVGVVIQKAKALRRSRLPLGTHLPTKPSSPERHPTRTKTHRERVPPQALWKRSGQHEPRRVPGRGAPLIEVVFRWTHTFQRSRLSSGTGFQRSRPHQNDTRHEPKRTGSGVPPQAISGSEADSMSRGGYPVTGRPSSKPSSKRCRSCNEVTLIRATTDTNQSAPGAGTPQAVSGSEADSMSRGGYPRTGRPSTESS